MERDVIRSGGRSEWRESVLAPLRALPDLREVWFTNMHMDTSMPTDSLPFCGGSPDTRRDTDSNNAPGLGPHHAQAATHLSSLENVVIVFNCCARNCDCSLEIHPTLSALPKSHRPESDSQGSPITARHPLAHLRLAIGYDAAALLRLRGAWQFVQLPGSQGQVDLSAKLLPELASGEYAYVKDAVLVIQVMPHLALDAGELARLREYFAAVDVEEIDKLPMVPVPDCVRDDAMVPGCFVSNYVLS